MPRRVLSREPEGGDGYAFLCLTISEIGMTSPDANSDTAPRGSPLNWLAVAALYAGLLLGIAWMVYWEEYRNAVWLGLIGTGGACTACARVLRHSESGNKGRHWEWAGAVFYAVFAVWAGSVLVRGL